MGYQVKVLYVDFDNKTPKHRAIENGINAALKEIDGEVTDINVLSPDSLRGVTVVITYKN